MSSALGLAALLGVVALVLFIGVGTLVLPTLLNIVVSISGACVISKKWGLRLVLAAVISIVLSVNVRIPSLIVDALAEPMVRSSISKKVVLGPSEKVRVDSDGEHIYYRRTSEPPRWGMQADWQIRIGHIPVVDERPVEILKRNGVAVSTKPDNQRIVLRIRREVSAGVMQIKAQLEDSGQVVATYEQRVRKSFLLEDFNHFGGFRDDWRAGFLYLTQATPWNPDKEIYPQGYAPFANFLYEAIAQTGVSPDGSPVHALLEPVNLRDRQVKSRASITFEYPVFGRAIPEARYTCEGGDRDRPFSVVGPGEVHWKDKDFPPLRVQGAPVDGYSPSFTGLWCEGDSFWLAAYHLKHINLWRYKVSFEERSLKLQQWLRPELPAVAQSRVDGWQRRSLTLGGIRQDAILVYLRGGTDRDNHLVEGYEIEVRADH